MAQVRKPIPKTPAQEVQDKIVPYELASYGKEPMVSKPNRALKVSQKGTREKNFSVKLVDSWQGKLEFTVSEFCDDVRRLSEWES